MHGVLTTELPGKSSTDYIGFQENLCQQYISLTYYHFNQGWIKVWDLWFSATSGNERLLLLDHLGAAPWGIIVKFLLQRSWELPSSYPSWCLVFFVSVNYSSAVCAVLPQSCLTLCCPMDCTPPGSSLHGIFQARILEQVDIYSSSGPSRPRDQTHVFSSASAGGFFTASAI